MQDSVIILLALKTVILIKGIQKKEVVWYDQLQTSKTLSPHPSHNLTLPLNQILD